MRSQDKTLKDYLPLTPNRKPLPLFCVLEAEPLQGAFAAGSCGRVLVRTEIPPKSLLLGMSHETDNTPAPPHAPYQHDFQLGVNSRGIPLPCGSCQGTRVSWEEHVMVTVKAT